MSEKDLVLELKATMADLSKDRDDALATVKTKESRLKQVLIKLEHSTSDVKTCGHKIEDQNKEIALLQAKLDTKEKLLDEALIKIKGIHDDSTKKTEPEEIDTEDEE